MSLVEIAKASFHNLETLPKKYTLTDLYILSDLLDNQDAEWNKSSEKDIKEGKWHGSFSSLLTNYINNKMSIGQRFLILEEMLCDFCEFQSEKISKDWYQSNEMQKVLFYPDTHVHKLLKMSCKEEATNLLITWRLKILKERKRNVIKELLPTYDLKGKEHIKIFTEFAIIGEDIENDVKEAEKKLKCFKDLLYLAII